MKTGFTVPVLLLLVAVTISPATASEAEPSIRYDLEVRLDPAGHRLEVLATVEVPETVDPAGSRFVLHGGLEPEPATEGVEITLLPGRPDPAWFHLADDSDAFPDDLPLEAYEIRSTSGGVPPRTFTLRYAGMIHHPLRAQGEEYARSFSETPGTIQDEGVYLAGSTYWFPWFGPHLVTFDLEVSTGQGWEALSGGARAAHETTEAGSKVRWESPEPLDDIHLVAGPFTIYEDRAGKVATYAYLRTPDEALARKYLDTTAQYLEMYGRLLGPYPYAKFALVENFWETGYGMPSFTLLGPKVIRFPFILHSSYPHEILHNWWGNGVFVDWGTGNWCEGLTAYLADHLIKEQRGQGAEYRRDLLQKYADYVRDGLDFPLTEFRSRHSSATQAVGYGKTAMLFHMLRLRLGDEAFVQALRIFYKDNRFRRASWADVRMAFESASGEDLEAFFRAWVEREGAPELGYDENRIVFRDPLARPRDWYVATVPIVQTQEGEPYPLQVPVAVTWEGFDEPIISRVDMQDGRADLDVLLRGGPSKIRIDPRFDLFRRVHREEIPSSFGQVFGAEKVTLVLPSSADDALSDAYRVLAESWSGSQAGEVETATDSDLDRLPADRAVWVFGWDNRLRKVFEDAVPALGTTLTGEALDFPGRKLDRSGHSVVVAVRHPGNPDLAVAFLGADNPAALPGLGRKLPHYGKYGYLAFVGGEPTNVFKGQWEPAGSPLDFTVEAGRVTGAGERVEIPEPEELPSPRALAELPPLYSGEKMREHVAFLADESMQGRGCGSEGLSRAADYIEKRFREYGLLAGWGKRYRHEFTGTCGDDGATTTMVNLAGVISGRKKEWRGQSVVVVAHYDHLGLGWPDVHEGDAGRIHPGADDNASGVAVMLELARVLRGSLKPDRDVVFLAVAGEESGLQGARAYVRDSKERPVSKTIGALNLDTVGRLNDRKILVIGAGSATEWVHIVRGAGYVTGVDAGAVMDDLGSSDHKAFLDAGVPAVQFFTGPHPDYHRPGDSADKLDVTGMVRTAAFVKEFVEYLAGREEPLTSTLESSGEKEEGGAPKPAHPGRGGRRVSLGTVPDFGYQGKGYRLGGVSPGSPAEGAGLKEGDVIIRIDDAAVEGLRDLSNALKGKEPGQEVTVTYLRDGEEAQVRLQLKAR